MHGAVTRAKIGHAADKFPDDMLGDGQVLPLLALNEEDAAVPGRDEVDSTVRVCPTPPLHLVTFRA